MAYLALYRMFRPTTLDDVVRQEHIVTVLKNQIDTGRVGHAYLFCGPRGPIFFPKENGGAFRGQSPQSAPIPAQSPAPWGAKGQIAAYHGLR